MNPAPSPAKNAIAAPISLGVREPLHRDFPNVTRFVFAASRIIGSKEFRLGWAWSNSIRCNPERRQFYRHGPRKALNRGFCGGVAGTVGEPSCDKAGDVDDPAELRAPHTWQQRLSDL